MGNCLKLFAGTMILVTNHLCEATHETIADNVRKRAGPAIERALLSRKRRSENPSPLLCMPWRCRSKQLDVTIPIGSCAKDRDSKVGKDIENPISGRVIAILSALRCHRSERIVVADKVRAMHAKTEIGHLVIVAVILAMMDRDEMVIIQRDLNQQFPVRCNSIVQFEATYCSAACASSRMIKCGSSKKGFELKSALYEVMAIAWDAA